MRQDSLKISLFPGHFESTKSLKNYAHHRLILEGVIFVIMLSCQRVCEHTRSGPALSKACNGQLALGNSALRASKKSIGTRAEERKEQLTWDLTLELSLSKVTGRSKGRFRKRVGFWENRMGGFRKGGFSNNRFVLKPDVAIASEVSILSKNSLAITDFHVKKSQHVQLFENPLPGGWNPPIRDSQNTDMPGSAQEILIVNADLRCPQQEKLTCQEERPFAGC